MDVRAQLSMVFHLDKCIGCHVCSIACKNIWTDRPGGEYMWWNNVETKPGTGYPTAWEDQQKYRGGWQVRGNALNLRQGGRMGTLASVFYNPSLPRLDDYYEPWTYRYGDLFDSPEGNDQPTARPVSMVTGEDIAIEAGPNWDDDYSGSQIYAASDPNLGALTDDERASLFQLDSMVFFYVPRICNHCLNPGCLGACPARAIYKRAEDGIVLVSQRKCRGWRFCISGCPYKKTYYNWKTGKAEKCILCYPRVETGFAQACFHTCVGRIRYTGIVLYDADLIRSTAMTPDAGLVEAQRSMILDPRDSGTVAGARKNGIPDDWIDAARRSPVYKLVKEWQLALPLHPEFRTIPMLFYVPPLLPVAASAGSDRYDLSKGERFGTIENTRIPVKYMASLFSAGNTEPVMSSLRKQWAVRSYKRSQNVGDVDARRVVAMLSEANCTAEEAEQVYRLTSLPRFGDRFVLPPYHREVSIEAAEDPQLARGLEGIGFGQPARRGP